MVPIFQSHLPLAAAAAATPDSTTPLHLAPLTLREKGGAGGQSRTEAEEGGREGCLDTAGNRTHPTHLLLPASSSSSRVALINRESNRSVTRFIHGVGFPSLGQLVALTQRSHCRLFKGGKLWRPRGGGGGGGGRWFFGLSHSFVALNVLLSLPPSFLPAGDN